MTQLNAFVARSFAPEDEERINPVLEFLKTFRQAGFLCETAEAAEVESVSKKVRRMIDEKDVFIGFFTKRYPLYNFTSRTKSAWQLLLGKLSSQNWSAPGWVLQESGYALAGGKDLILLREPGVEVPGLQGDLEYIPFDPANPTQVFSKLSEMINGLLAKAAGTEVRVIVTERDDQSQVAIEASAPEPQTEAPKDASGNPDITELLFRMVDASSARDFEGITGAWTAGSDLISGGWGEEIDQLKWNCFYHESRFDAGAADGMEALKRLRVENSSRAEPIEAMARCLSSSKEFEESARLFLKAAELQDGPAKARSLMRAASEFREAKQYEQGKMEIELALSIATGELREEAVSVKYQLLKASGDDYLAFAVAESALSENPNLRLRFSLGLDYHRRDLNELALFHFKYLHDLDKKDSSSLHNLALMYSECKLPMLSVVHYKAAFAIGETLSAANLGFMYVDSGMAEEARGLIDQAIKIEPHEARVEKCLAEIIQRNEKEHVKESELLELASTNRTFFVTVGRAIETKISQIGGRWKFPFGEMTITLLPDGIIGVAEITTEESGFGQLLVASGTSKSIRIDEYTLRGKLTGSVCQFDLTIAEKSSIRIGVRTLASLAGPKSGFIVFAPDGESAIYLEVSGRKLEKTEKLTKLV